MYKNLIIKLEWKDTSHKPKDEEKEAFEEAFIKDYSKYKRKDLLYFESWEYAIPSNKENLNVVQERIVPFVNYLEPGLRVEEEYEPSDYDKAAAYKVEFPYGFHEYDNFDHKEKFESEIRGCFNCPMEDKKEILYLAFDGARKFRTDYAGHSDQLDAQIVSVLLQEHLIDSGIDKDFFRPVYNMRQTLLGYRLYGEKNILPSNSVGINGEDDHGECEICGRTAVWSFPLHSINTDNSWRINDEGVEALRDINYTYEYRPTQRMTIINKKTYSLINEVWPEVNKYLVPIFKW